MGDLDKRLERWILAIAADIQSGRCPLGALEHLDKHMKEFRCCGNCSVFREWFASLENLVDIVRLVHNVGDTTALRLVRLQQQYEKLPTERTPEPTQESSDGQ